MKTGTALYYVTALPTLGEPGSKPPIAFDEFREMLGDESWAHEPVDAVLLQDDLMQRESFLAGESTEVGPAVLTPAQARNEAPLPEFLQADDDEAPDTAGLLEVDRLWSNYFRHVVAMSRRIRCPFLREWARFEVGLRNALAVARAERLGLAGEDYRVATELESFEDEFDDIVGEWARADNPLSAYRVLIRSRWDWAGKHERWFTFRTDELAAYAVRLTLLHQAYRLGTLEEQTRHGQSGSTGKGEVDTK